jgi:hypothetical protein
MDEIYIMKTRIEILILVITVLSFCGCKKNSTEPLPGTNSTYMSMNIGDVRQLVFLTDSSTILMKVVGTTKRTDGLDVFVVEQTYGVGLFNEYPDTSYYMIKDGYYMSTNLYPFDSTSNPQRPFNSTNPFAEERLGKVNPINGETWKQTLGDPDSSFFTASYYKEQHTFCGTFTNVYGFTLTEVNAGKINTILTTFYAENIGYIGTDWNDDSQLNVSATYVKVANQVYGALWPTKNTVPHIHLSKRGINHKFSVRAIAAYSLLGVKNARYPGATNDINPR